MKSAVWRWLNDLCDNFIQKNNTIVCLGFNLISSSVLGRGVCCKDVNGDQSIIEGL